MEPVLGELDAGSDDLAKIRSCLADLAEGLSCSAAFVLLRAGRDASILAAHGLPGEAASAYATRWHRVDPWLAARQRAPGGDCVCARTSALPRALRASGFQAGWLQPHHFGPAAIADVAAANGTDALLYVLRPAGARPLSGRELALLRAVAVALGLLVRRADLSLGAAAAAEVMSRTTAPVLLLLPDGTLLWSNIAAERLWSNGGPLRRIGRRIAARSAEAAPVFAEALAAEAAPTAKARVIGLGCGAAKVPARLQPFVLRSGRTAVLMTAAAAAPAAPTATAVAAALGLTRSQSEIAVLLCQGMETSEIAERVGISPHTLNGHLRDLYGRLSASNRVQAVVRLLGATAAFGLFDDQPVPEVSEGQLAVA